MKNRSAMLISVLAAALSMQAQVDSSFELIRRFKGDITAFAVDNLENIYLLSSSDQLKKLNAAGDSVAVYNNIRKNGKLSLIDVSNPLRVLLYYKNFSQVVILDRLLNIRNTIDLRDQNIFQVQAICLSYDNGIWLYDELENKLKKIDEEGKLVFETADFRQLFGEAFTFISITDMNGLIYLYDRKKGIFAFDYYGALKNRIPFTGADHIKITGQVIQGIRNDSLIRYQPQFFTFQEYPLPPLFHDAISLSYSSSKLYVLKRNELAVYNLKQADIN